MIQIRLAVVVFISGACVMMLELCGSRVLAPMIGSSIFVWTSLIGAILAALSLGYWKGGELADRKPTRENLSMILVIASCMVALIPLLSVPFLIAMSRLALDPRLSALISSFLLFAAPSVAMGMVPPYALRLSVQSVDSSGRSVGLLTACSTLGSLAGTFLLGFFLLSKIGTMNTLFGIAVLLALSAIIAHPRFRLPLKLSLFLALALIFHFFAVFSETVRAQGVIDLDTAYQRVLVYDYQRGDPPKNLRALSTGPEGTQSVMDRDNPTDFIVEYLTLFAAGMKYSAKVDRALLIGGGGFSFPKYIAKHYPETKLDVVELDPGITDIARKYFQFVDTPNISIFHEDARIFLNRLRESAEQPKYDIIFADAYTSAANIPFHLTTKEFFRALSDSLSKDGTAVVNVIGSLQGPQSCMYRIMMSELKNHFSDIAVYRAIPSLDPSARQNIIIRARRGHSVGFVPATFDALDKTLQDSAWIVRTPEPPFELTDDFAPSEHVMNFGC